MNNKKHLLCAVTSLMAISLMVACNQRTPTSSEPKPLEVGDTVKEWVSTRDLNKIPLGVSSEDNKGEIVNDNGFGDKSSLKYIVKNSQNNYVGSDLIEEPYFIEDDAKNGDIISLYVLAETGSNIASFQLEVLPNSMNNGIKSDLLNIDSTNQGVWKILEVSFDTLETLGAIRLNYTLLDDKEPAEFYVDNINITYGEETVQTDYVFNDESLYKAYEPYFKVGGCMSTRMMGNTELRKLVKDNW